MIGEDRPTAAFTLSVVGLVLQAFGGLLFVYALPHSSSYGFFGFRMTGPWMMSGGPWMFGYLSYWFLLFAILAGIEITPGVLGVLWMNTANLSRVRTGSVFVLVASIIAFPTMFGFMIGSVLMLIGSILGLTWQPRIRSGG